MDAPLTNPTLARAPGAGPIGLLRGGSRWAARVAGVAALAGSVGASLWVVLAAAERPGLSGPAKLAGFAPWIVGPLGHRLPGLTHAPHQLHLDLTRALVVLLVCWVVAAVSAPLLPRALVAGALVVASVVFVLGPPLSLTDLFNYLHYGRMGALHGLNPYTALPVAARADPTWALSNWHHLPSPYGPLFTLTTYALAPLPVHTAYWVWKVVVLAATLGILALVWHTARVLGRSPQAAAAFVGLNPLVLVYGIGGAHNDPLMLLPAVGAVALVAGGAAGARRSAAGGAAVVGAAAVKLSALALAPLVVLAAPRRRAALAGAVGAAVLAGAVVATVFGGHLPATALQDRLATPLSVPQLTGWFAGLGGQTAEIRTIAHAVLAAVVLAASLLVWRRRELLPAAAGAVMLAAILTLGWVMPWYIWWVLPFAALARTRTLAVLCVLATLWLGVGAVPQMAHIIHHFGYYPSRTPVGRAQHLYVERLLK